MEFSAVILAAGGLMVAGCGGSAESMDSDGMTKWTDASSVATQRAVAMTEQASECPTYDLSAWEACMDEAGTEAWLIHDEIDAAAEMGLKLNMPVECKAAARHQVNIADAYMTLGDHMNEGVGSVTKITTSAKRVTAQVNVGTGLFKKCTAAIKKGA